MRGRLNPLVALLVLPLVSAAAAQDLDRAAPTSARSQAMIIEADEGGYADVVGTGDTVYLSGYVAGLREGAFSIPLTGFAPGP